jgi:N utilization substance protein B
VGTRRAAREQALQALYQLDMAGDAPGGWNPTSCWAHVAAPDEVEPFARELVEGVVANRKRIDALVAESAEHWRLSRLSRVDLSVLRLGAFELLGRADIPSSVTINEAVEIARRFGSEESAAFVNGVLDHVAEVLGVKGRPRSAE